MKTVNSRALRAASGIVAAAAVACTIGITAGAAQAVGPHANVATINVGSSPNGITLAPGTHRAYSAVSGANKVSVIDTTSNTVVDSIALGAGTRPYGVAIDPVSNRAYTSNNGTGTVSVIDLTDDTVLSSITVGNNPDGIGYDSASDRVYVTRGQSNTVAVIDPDTGTFSDITVGSAPSSVAFDPTQNTGFVTNYLGQSVSVIDTTTGTVIATVALSGRAQRVAVDAVHHIAYVTVGNTVALIDTTSGAYLRSIAVGSGAFGVGVDPVHDTLYVANGDDNTVSLIDTTDDSVQDTIAVGAFPVGVAVDPDLDSAFVNDFSAGTVSVLAPAQPDQSQSITFTSTKPSKPAVGGSYTVTATGGDSGNPVTFSADPATTACTVTDNGDSTATVALVHAGQCVIDADQAGAPGYDAAPQAKQSFAVAKGKQQITFTSTKPGKARVGGTYTVTATGGASGKPVVFVAPDVDRGICTLQDNRDGSALVSFVGPGRCNIKARQGGTGDYLAAPVVQQVVTVKRG